MSLEKSTITWSAKQITVMIKNGKINFDHVTQRSYVWEKTRKTALIESMILGYPIPAIFAKRLVDSEKRNNNIYYIMDGKQRLSTIADYISNEFALTKISPIKFTDSSGEEQEIDISGLFFENLPELLQDIIKDTMFNILYFDNLTNKEERELFKRLNAGKPLSAKSRTLVSCNDIENLLKIGEHKLFTEMLSSKALMNKDHVTIIVKTWIMMNIPINEISFESKRFNMFVEEIAISQDEEAELNILFDYIVDLHSILRFKNYTKTAKKLYTEIHFVSLIPFLVKAINKQYDINKVADWLVSFFETDSGTSISEEYNNNSMAKVARSSTIMKRNDVLSESFDKYINFIEHKTVSQDVNEDGEYITQ